MNNIKVRIAPSPTGLLHIGTARTALFNYLFAKKNNGQFVLRIEDTDLARSKKEYEKDILDGLKWLGINWDNEKIYYQTENKDLYLKVAKELLDSGSAYEKDGAIWFKLDSYKEEEIKYNDLILGEINYKKESFNDFVIIKSDGIPLYQFACTVDDHNMQMTHVIRGADHINSTPQQIMIYRTLGWDVPEFGHIPLILNSDRSKMSKRKNPVSITNDFKNTGYLPEAIVNYIAFLGWNPKNNEEFFSLEKLIKEFDLKKINKSGAIFDIEKLNYFNNHYLKEKSAEEIYNLLLELGCDEKIFKDKETTFKIIEVIKPRMNNACEFIELSDYFFKPGQYDKESLIFKKSDLNNTKLALENVFEWLESAKTDWKIDNINKELLEIVSKNNLTNGDLFWPVRMALSGKEKSASPTELLWVLGKEESKIRIKVALDKLS